MADFRAGLLRFDGFVLNQSEKKIETDKGYSNRPLIAPKWKKFKIACE